MTFFLTALLVANYAHFSSSAPHLIERDTSQTVGWVSEPNGRGTVSLVTSCVLTLGVCVWSAMHLNIPPRGESSWQRWVRNIRWGLAGVFGPELVLFIAWKQYLSARAIAKKAQPGAFTRDRDQHMGKTKEKSPQEVAERAAGVAEDPTLSWTVVHGFYAGMGGFVFPINTPGSIRDCVLQDHCHHLTLTAQGVALLAECGLLPDISREDVVDKSKSDGLGKLLACVQGLWMASQIIGRLGFGYQVTLLEINTLAHVLCALIMYVLWWHKPRLIQEPTIIEGDWVGPLAAYMYMSSRLSGGGGKSKQSLMDPELSSMLFYQKLFDTASHGVSQRYDNSPAHAGVLGVGDGMQVVHDRSGSIEAQPEITLQASDHETIEGSFGPESVLNKTAEDVRKTIEHISVGDEMSDLGDRQKLRWRLATQAFCKYPAVRSRFQRMDNADMTKKVKCWQERHPKELVTEYSGNWSTSGLLPGVFGVVMGVVLWSASMAFGAIHAAAWYDYFPTSAEAWMWRCSSLYIIGSGLLWSLINLFAKISKAFDDHWNQLRRPSPPWVSSVPLAIVCAWCGAAYAFARMFLVIEAFISIRQLPPAAYDTPNWTVAIPHL